MFRTMSVHKIFLISSFDCKMNTVSWFLGFCECTNDVSVPPVGAIFTGHIKCDVETNIVLKPKSQETTLNMFRRLSLYNIKYL